MVKGPPVQGGSNPKKQKQAKQPLQTEEEKQKEIKRLRKEIIEKERIEKRMLALEEEARLKERAYKEKFNTAEKRRQEQIEQRQAKAVKASRPYVAPTNQRLERSSSVPAERK